MTYRSAGPLAKLAPKAPWYRIVWAWCRGVFAKAEARRRRVNIVRDAYIMAMHKNGVSVGGRPVPDKPGPIPYSNGASPVPYGVRPTIPDTKKDRP